jgi:hypothetical protein
MTDGPAVDYDDPATEIAEVNADQLTDEIVTEIERPRQGDPSESGSDGYMAPHALPGYGEPYDDCGEPIDFFCKGCGDTFEKGRRCKRSVCRECAPLWDVDRSENDLARLRTVAKVMGAEMGESVKMHHLVFTPPSANDETDHDWYLDADDPIQRTREVVAAILKLLNAEGLIYYHGWSGEQGDDRGEWKDRQFSGRDFEGDVRSELKPRPHFHCIVASPFVAGGQITKQITEQTGWVIERIAGDDGKSLPDLHAAARAITYCLSHTSIRLGYATNGDNRVIKAAYGKKWHSNTVNVRDNSRRQAERAVRSVAPRTLGISPSRMRCETDVPLNERGERVEVGDAYDDADPDLDDAASEPDSASSDGDCEEEGCDDPEQVEDVETVTCKGVIKPLAEADEVLEDDEWVAEAIHSEELRRRYQDFKAQAQLDNPPPMVSAFC